MIQQISLWFYHLERSPKYCLGGLKFPPDIFDNRASNSMQRSENTGDLWASMVVPAVVWSTFWTGNKSQVRCMQDMNPKHYIFSKSLSL